MAESKSQSEQRKNVMLPADVHTKLCQTHTRVSRDRAPYWRTVSKALDALESEVTQ